MTLLDLVCKEYFAIVEHLHKKIPSLDGRIIVNAQTFYTLLDRNLYITRSDKLNIYKILNLIIRNSSGLTSVIYDKETKKTKRKIIINYDAYKTFKKLYETNFEI